MPQIIFRGVNIEDVKSISKNLLLDLQEIIGCPNDYLTIEVIDSTFIEDGEITKGYPFIQVGWFDRGQDIQDRVAKSITKYLNEVGYESCDVIFNVYSKTNYYENGNHF